MIISLLEIDAVSASMYGRVGVFIERVAFAVTIWLVIVLFVHNG
jgi:hypothetical protein